jgi:site-specific DNA-methyltransferase (adenine-specific)
MAMAEYAWCSFNENAKIYECAPQDSNRFHPTQKPLSLIMWQLEKYSKPDDIILDPFSGSGTTAIASHRLGRRFICIEKDAEYHAASVERLNRECQQLQLPGLLAGPEPQQGDLWERRGN